MKPTGRKITKWRKKSPMVHRSFADKRGRRDKDAKEQMKEHK